MWIILKDGSLEITAQEANKSSHLVVKGRGPVQRLFPDVESCGPTDTHFHEFAMIDRRRVADTIANEIRAIRYKSFRPDPSDLDSNAGVRAPLGCPMPPGDFVLDLDGPVLVERFSETVAVTMPCSYGSAMVTMTAQQARRFAEELANAIIRQK